jgi:hypothetical protein
MRGVIEEWVGRMFKKRCGAENVSVLFFWICFFIFLLSG